MSDIVKNNEPIVTDMVENNVEVPLEKQAQPKKPRTEKQIEAFKQTQLKRAENIANKKAGVVAKPVIAPVVVPVVEPKKEYKVPVNTVESDSEEEVIIRRKKRTPDEPKAKPKRKVVIELSDTESEEEEQVREPEKKVEEKTKSTKFDSQQNKKHSKPIVNDNNKFFCD